MRRRPQSSRPPARPRGRDGNGWPSRLRDQRALLPTEINDQTPAYAVGEALAWTVDVPANAVKADVRDQRVTLTGRVTRDCQRRPAVHGLAGGGAVGGSGWRRPCGLLPGITARSTAGWPGGVAGVEQELLDELLHRGAPLRAPSTSGNVECLAPHR
ncbi:BON domain-containing protein [Dactylosporangium sp. NPDC049140]|uniref:BON domain-containing protein n=1 Tax=Dactylosporangium sp. NPDC049140 TaxID=3155647 RepID=UPI00340444CE